MKITTVKSFIVQGVYSKNLLQTSYDNFSSGLPDYDRDGYIGASTFIMTTLSRMTFSLMSHSQHYKNITTQIAQCRSAECRGFEKSACLTFIVRIL